MMNTAREMYDHTVEVNRKFLLDELCLVEDYIKDAADDGDYTVTIDKRLSDDATIQLQKLGYIVKDGIDDPRDGYRTTIISWKLDDLDELD